MHVILGMHREVEVDHVRDPFDVDAARGDVGGDEHSRASRFERVQRGDALVLRTIGVQRGGDDPLLRELARDLVGAVLGA